jgi:hypothetical protein
VDLIKIQINHQYNHNNNNGHIMHAHIVVWKIKIVLLNVQIKFVVNGSVIKE